MSHDHIQAVLNDVGNEFGLADLALQEHDHVCVTTDDGVFINLEYFEDDDTLLLFSTVGEVSDENRQEVLETLLRANFLWETARGTTLSLEPEGNRIFLMCHVPAALLTTDGLITAIDRMDRLSWMWSEVLAGRVPGIIAAASAGHAPAQESHLRA